MTQKRFTIRIFGVSSVSAFLRAADRCENPVFLDFDGTVYNLKEDEKLRRMLSEMATDDRLDAILPVNVASEDLVHIVGVMNRKAA